MKRILLSALVIASCASLPDWDWEAQPSGPALTPVYIEVHKSVLKDACYPYIHAWACAVRMPLRGFCYIYTEPDPPRWIIEHEEKHCKGYKHPWQK